MLFIKGSRGTLIPLILLGLNLGGILLFIKVSRVIKLNLGGILLLLRLVELLVLGSKLDDSW